MKIRFITVATLLISLVLPMQAPAQAADPLPPIESTNYPYVAGLARASLLSFAPLSNTQIAVNYLIENGVTQTNQDLIKESISNFIGHFGPQLSDSTDPIQVVVLKTIAGGKALAETLASTYQGTVTSYFNVAAVDPAKYACMPMRATAYGAKRLIFIEAPCETSAGVSPSGDPVLPAHELTHQLQASINNGVQCRVGGNAIWLCEGQANVIGSILAVYKGVDYWKIGRRQMWSAFLPKNRQRTIEDLRVMEGETDPARGVNLSDSSQVLSEYSVGAALSEYLMAWGGFSNSLLLNQVTAKNRNGINGFKDAFSTVYGIGVDAFYEQALPYVNYVVQNSDMTDISSPEATKFISDWMMKIDKAAADKAAADKAAADKAAADKAAADKAAADKAAAAKKKTIICIKGKLIKKVTSVNPKCPSGYKIKKK